MKKSAVLAGKILKSNLAPLKAPYKLTYALTYRCNHRCKICDIWKKQPENELGPGDIDLFFKSNPYFSWVDLTGGEIFAVPHLYEAAKSIIKHCKNLYLLHYPTNGSLTERIVEETKKIVALKPKKLIATVSLDGDPETNAELRGVDDAWERSVETFIELRTMRGVEVYLGCTLSAGNMDKIDALIDSVRTRYPAMRRRDLHVNFLNRSPHYFDNMSLNAPDYSALLRSIAEFAALKEKSWNPTLLVEKRYLRLCERFFRTGRTPVTCQSLSASCFLDPTGDVYPCTIYGRKLGNIRDFNWDLRKLLASAYARRTRGEIREGDCPNCWTPCEAYQSIFGSLLKSAAIRR